eukprot:m.159110 g.159110  ORF g.159110 m.159110 type:complete len:495 (+) comp11742_c0_seq1:85-1569(+)
MRHPYTVLYAPSMAMLWWVPATLLVLPCCSGVDALTRVTLSNTVPRRDVNGQIVNCHDGAVVQDNTSGLFYMYGISFPESCTSALYDDCVSKGSCMGPLVRPCAYQSHDLITWTLASSDLLPGQNDFGDQARVLYNPHTAKYVFIYRGKIGRVTSLRVAVGDGPTGPFTELDPLDTDGDRVGSQAGWHVDGHGNGYAWYNTDGPPGTLFPARQCVVELTRDFLNVTGRKSCWVPSDGFGLEGGALWDRGGTYYWAAGSPCCNCALGGSARVYTTHDPMGNWTFLTNLNPPRQPRPPRPPPHLLTPGSSPASRNTCEEDLVGSWVGSVYLASGGQPLRGGIRVDSLGNHLYNFTESQPHNRMVVGVGKVTSGTNNHTLTITIVSGPSQGAVGVMDAWPGLNDSGCSRIIWEGAVGTTWGKSPFVPETDFQVNTQMFGVSTLWTANGTVHMYTGERYQTAPDGVFGHGFMYWQPLVYNEQGVPDMLQWTDEFQLTF